MTFSDEDIAEHVPRLTRSTKQDDSPLRGLTKTRQRSRDNRSSLNFRRIRKLEEKMRSKPRGSLPVRQRSTELT
jgi:hypothetical protein